MSQDLGFFDVSPTIVKEALDRLPAGATETVNGLPVVELMGQPQPDGKLRFENTPEMRTALGLVSPASLGIEGIKPRDNTAEYYRGIGLGDMQVEPSPNDAAKKLFRQFTGGGKDGNAIG